MFACFKNKTIVRIFIGETGIGKSTMIKRLTNDESIVTSIGGEGCQRECSVYRDSKKCNVFYMDTPGTGDSKMELQKLREQLLLIIAREQIKCVKIVWYNNDYDKMFCVFVFELQNLSNCCFCHFFGCIYL